MAEHGLSSEASETAAYFDRCARDGVMADFEPEHEEKVRALLAEWDLRPGQRVLEPGCGAGRLTERLAESVGPDGFVYAFDLSAGMIEHARARGLPAHVRFEVADIAEARLEPGDFDACICFHVFPHFADKARALGEIARVLKPGAALWVNHMKPREELNAFHRTVAPEVASHQLPPDDEMRALLAAAGFADVRISDSGAGYSLRAARE
jgi:demethylmenaquinone methyltransferase/2-methoxy-6-polyprenyl-1,4-benzoquinol methylase